MDLELRRLADPTLVVVAVVYGLLWLMARFAGFFGLHLALLLFFSCTRYGYVVLRALAQGKPTAAPDIESMNPVEDYRAVLHSTFFGGAIFVLGAGSSVFPTGLATEAARLVGGLALVVAFPGSAALLALNGDLGMAMNPRLIVSIARTLGRRYAWLLAIWALLALAVLLVMALPWPWPLGAPLDAILIVWAGLAVYASIGLVLRAHRHLLDIPGERVPVAEIRAKDERREWQSFLDRAYASIRGGLPAQGYKTINDLVESERGSAVVQQWIFERMLSWEDKSHAVAFARRLVAALLESGQDYEALEVVTRCRRVSASLALDPTAAARIAEFARSIGRHGVADELAETARGAG
ncbi:MAG TPA: hypothetical protein VFV10_03290 [Gammaproteobacteria bacterium]|nr:hypothetical protein [Gammaproteobacteria bacterium]